MTVFLAHAPADRQAADALEKIIERRGQFVELDDGHTAMKPIGHGDALVLLVSQALVFATARLRLEQRALDAWAQGRLVVVKLDRGIAPVGLRDLPAIDATFEAAREFKWNEVADAVRDIARAPPPVDAEEGGAEETQPSPAPTQRGSARSVLRWLLPLALLLPGLLALYVSVSIWLVNRIGPTPGGWSELAAGIDDLGQRFGLAPGLTIWLFAGAMALLVAALGFIVAGFISRSASRAQAQAPAPARNPPRPRPRGQAAPAADAVFVSYARANDMTVLPLVEAAKRAGRKFWLDQQGISAGDGWAGEIVRAIKAAGGVVVMCSKAAFESDHVKREIYLADRYRKLVPVFIERAEPPEDFEYFFAGVQSLNLYDTPEDERSEALVRMLGAAA